jgi:transposase
VRAVTAGMSITEGARVFGVSRQSMHIWMRRWRRGGARTLRSRPRERPARIQLAPHQAATTVRLIRDRCPDQVKLPFAL